MMMIEQCEHIKWITHWLCSTVKKQDEEARPKKKRKKKLNPLDECLFFSGCGFCGWPHISSSAAAYIIIIHMLVHILFNLDSGLRWEGMEGCLACGRLPWTGSRVWWWVSRGTSRQGRGGRFAVEWFLSSEPVVGYKGGGCPHRNQKSSSFSHSKKKEKKWLPPLHSKTAMKKPKSCRWREKKKKTFVQQKEKCLKDGHLGVVVCMLIHPSLSSHCVVYMMLGQDT